MHREYYNSPSRRPQTNYVRSPTPPRSQSKFRSPQNSRSPSPHRGSRSSKEQDNMPFRKAISPSIQRTSSSNSSKDQILNRTGSLVIPSAVNSIPVKATIDTAAMITLLSSSLISNIQENCESVLLKGIGPQPVIAKRQVSPLEVKIAIVEENPTTQSEESFNSSIQGLQASSFSVADSKEHEMTQPNIEGDAIYTNWMQNYSPHHLRQLQLHDLDLFPLIEWTERRETIQPIQLLFGTVHCSVGKFDPDSWVAQLAKLLNEVHKLARENLMTTQHRQKRDYDLRLAQNQYHTGDLVYKIDSSTKIGHSKKLRSPWIGPYLVVSDVSALYNKGSKGRVRDSP
ncbi:unnamed protein product [Mytilus coruscus]|uniref:Integrase zinc-binding domain-containing protein n=1 Tax=Mytilus coruscus TaxID=42192 RepID=A0A6J8DUZ2_MYTCO|nr:unnamed protein product [Mytilus coruscus]